MGTQAAVDLYLLRKTGASGCINFYHKLRVVWVINHCGIVPRPKKLPGFGHMADFDWVVGIYAFNLEPRK
jgi:hypothetical protein